LGPVLFLLYVQPLSGIIASRDVSHHAYSDDTQLYKSGSISQVEEICSSVSRCISDVRSWMTENKLKLNEGKTEAMLITSPRSSSSALMPDHFMIENASISFSQSVKNLGVVLEHDLSMKKQVLSVCRAAYMEIRRIGSVRHLLSTEATKTLVCAFVLSRLDYANSLLSGCPQYLLDKLQRVQNTGARLVAKTKRKDHISPVLQALHWLPVRDRVNYKILSVCHVSLSSTGPSYLSDLLHLYTPPRQLRSSSDTRILTIPSVRTKTFGQRSFAHQGPVLWNVLPRSLRHTESSVSFKHSLKTFLFRSIESQ
jgi:hypothetical protein